MKRRICEQEVPGAVRKKKRLERSGQKQDRRTKESRRQGDKVHASSELVWKNEQDSTAGGGGSQVLGGRNTSKRGIRP